MWEQIIKETRSTNLLEGKQMDESWEGSEIHQVSKKGAVVAGIQNGKIIKGLKNQSLASHIPSTHTTQLHSYPHTKSTTTLPQELLPLQAGFRLLHKFLFIFDENQIFVSQIN